jgi:hypothetical protein
MKVVTIIGSSDWVVIQAVRKSLTTNAEGIITLELGVYDLATGGYNEEGLKSLQKLLLEKISVSQEVFVVDFEPLSQNDKEAIQYASNKGKKITFLSNNVNHRQSIEWEIGRIKKLVKILPPVEPKQKTPLKKASKGKTPNR